MTDCIFCRIADHSSPATIRHESENVIVFDSTNPVADRHLLIVPKLHIQSFKDLDNSNKDLIMEMVGAAQKMVDKYDLVGGYKLVFNVGKYQVVPHLHWHMLAGNLEDNNDILNKT